jgi:hypothetical protein
LRVVAGLGLARPHAELLGHFGHDAGDVGHLGAQRVCRIGIAAGTQIAADQLSPGPIRRCAGLFKAAPPQHRHTLRFGLRCQLLHQPGLAHAAGAGQQHDPAASSTRTVQRLAELRQLLLATDEQARRAQCGACRRHGRGCGIGGRSRRLRR